MGPFLFLINWSLVKCVFMKSLWDRVCISYGTLHITHKLNFESNLCSLNPYGTVCEFLMGPFLFLINWTLVKCESKNSLLNRECIYISYGTLPITHKLIFGQICVHEIHTGPRIDFYGTFPISHKMIFGKICVHEILMGPCVHFLWDPSYYS